MSKSILVFFFYCFIFSNINAFFFNRVQSKHLQPIEYPLNQNNFLQKAITKKFPDNINENNIIFAPYLNLSPYKQLQFNESYSDIKDQIESILQQLQTDSNQVKLTINQLAYFMKYWSEITNDKKDLIKSLISQGKLQFSGGEYVSANQCSSSFEDFIQQLIVGQNFLKEELNYFPRIALSLQNEAFLNTYSYLLMRSGIEGVFIESIAQAESIANEFFQHFSGDQNQKLWTHINNFIKSEISFELFPDVSEILVEQNDDIAHQFLDYLINLEQQKENYQNKNMINLIDVRAKELKQDSVIRILEELVKIINKVEDLRQGNFRASFNSPQELLEQLAINTQIEQKGIELEQNKKCPMENLFVVKGLSKWRNLEKFVVLETIKTLKIGNDEKLKEIQEIQLQLEILEKELLFAQNEAIVTSQEQLEMKEKISAIEQKIGYILSNNENETFSKLNENALFDNLKEKRSQLLILLNNDVNQLKLVKLKVPFSNIKVLSSENEEQKCDIICENKENCMLYLVVRLNAWSQTVLKIIVTDEEKDRHSLQQKERIEFENSAGALFLAIDGEQNLQYSYCKKSENEELKGEINAELNEHQLNIEENSKQQIMDEVYQSLVQRIKEQKEKILNKEKLQRFAFIALKSEVQKSLEAKGLIKSNGLKKSVTKAISQYDIPSKKEKKRVENEVLKEMQEMIDVQQWIMMEKIIEKMEIKTGQKVTQKQRKVISDEVRKQVLAQVDSESAMASINEKIESKLRNVVKNKGIEENIDAKKENLLKLKNELVLLKESKQKLMERGEIVSDKLVENILEKEERIQELNQKIRASQQRKLDKQAQKQKKQIKRKEKMSKMSNNSQVLIKEVDKEFKLKEEAIEKKEMEINELKQKLQSKEQEYENSVRKMKEIKEEITEDKNSLVEEEKELHLIQMDKLQKKLENEKKKRGSLLERIDKLGSLRKEMQEMHEKEQEIQQQVSVFGQYLHQKHNQQKVIKNEDQINKHVYKILSKLMNNMEREEKKMMADQENLATIENQIEQEKQTLASHVKDKEISLVQIQTEREKLEEKIKSYSFLEMENIVYTAQNNNICLEQKIDISIENKEKNQSQPDISFYQGEVIGQVVIKYPGIKKIFTIYQDFIDLQFVEVEIFTEPKTNQNNVLLVTSNIIKNEQQLIIDNNGYFLTEHTINHNQLNYYQAHIATIKDQQSNLQMNVNLEEPAEITSEKEGQIKILLNENLRFGLSFTDNNNNDKNFVRIRTLEKLLYDESIIFLSELPNSDLLSNQKPWICDYKIPEYIKIQYRFLKEDAILLHLSNLSDDPYEIQLFETYKVSISNIFGKITGMMIKFEEIEETTLTGNQVIMNSSQDIAEGLIKLMPMQTRAFLFKL